MKKRRIALDAVRLPLKGQKSGGDDLATQKEKT
jgi:hypothetical protein